MTRKREARAVLVTGATGPHGGAVAGALLSAGRRVRVLTRNAGGAQARELGALGAELATGDLLDRAALIDAMEDVSAVYAVTTPFGAGADAEIEQGRQIIAAASAVQLPWLVLASVASADRASGVPHFESKWQIEQQLRSSGVPYTVVAPTYFYENLGDPRQTIADGELALALPASRPLQQIALADVGATVASILTRERELLGQRIELAADQPTPQQMAEALSVAGSKPIRYTQLELDAVAARSADLAAMNRFLMSGGYQVDIAAVRTRFHDVNWTTFTEWVNAAVDGADRTGIRAAQRAHLQRSEMGRDVGRRGGGKPRVR
jgi:uncharacterized protein YbjT (DUF2867 family)